MAKGQSVQLTMLRKLDNHMQNSESGHLNPTAQTETNSKWLTDLNVTPEAINLLDGKTDLDLGNDFFFDMTQKGKQQKEK